MKRILVGLGGTEYTVTAISQAVALAVANDAEVTGVTILDKERLSHVGPVPIGGGHHAHELVDDRLHDVEAACTLFLAREVFGKHAARHVYRQHDVDAFRTGRVDVDAAELARADDAVGDEHQHHPRRGDVRDLVERRRLVVHQEDRPGVIG